ncbi:MFS transporter [Roseomonas elaeocarpi]|uniref:MFS transporter n=1 Tax=Roseomonas elaeocarpi TaxID=907779 RepID=A0ABV6JWS6_9PROT
MRPDGVLRDAPDGASGSGTATPAWDGGVVAADRLAPPHAGATLPLSPPAGTEAVSRDVLYAKVARRIVPVLILAFLAAYLDRVNVGFAKLQMSADLGFSDSVYGIGAGIFFLGYFLFEVPSNLILHRVGARTWLARIMVTWAIISGLTFLVREPWQFYGMRFLLGLAEAGFMPGVIYYLSAWFPSDRRGRVIGVYFIGLGVAGFIGGPLSGLILHAMSGWGGLDGWQWLFIVEAVPSFAVGVALYLWLDNHVADAHWLDAREKAAIAADIAAEQGAKTPIAVRSLLGNGAILLMTGAFFIANLCLYGLGFWLPTLIGRLGVADPLLIGLMSALPSLCGIVTMVLVSRSSDRTGERRWHVAGLFLLGAVGLGLSVLWSDAPLPGLFALCLATAGLISIPALFWNLPTAMLGGVAAAAGLALINSLANLSGFLGPWIVGRVSDVTGGTGPAILFLGVTLVVGAALILLIPRRLVEARSGR